MAFSCNGTIIGLTVNLTEKEGNEVTDGNPDGDQDDEKQETSSIKFFPSIQVWRLSNSKPAAVYIRAGQYNICDSDIKTDGKSAIANVSLIANKSIRFQSGDIIGYYVPANSTRSILNIQAMENTSYSINASAALDEFVIDDSVTGSSMLPLIQVMFGKRVIIIHKKCSQLYE